MQKTAAVASLGQYKLMLPAVVKAALSANDRLKVYLTVLQAASSHAAEPQRELPDLGAEMGQPDGRAAASARGALGQLARCACDRRCLRQTVKVRVCVQRDRRRRPVRVQQGF